MELKIKFEYEGQKRVILLPQPVKYQLLTNKLQQLCGSMFTIEYSSAEGQFIREIECQEDLDEVISLTRSHHMRMNCLPLRLVPCATASIRSQSCDYKKTFFPLSSSLPSLSEKDCGGFFLDEAAESFISSEFQPCNNSPSPEVLASPLKHMCIHHRNRSEARVDYITDFCPSPVGHHCAFAPGLRDFKLQNPSDKKEGRSFHRVLPLHTVDLTAANFPSTFEASDEVLDKVTCNPMKSNVDGLQNNVPFLPGQWIKGKFLGQGAFGQVFTGYDVNAGIEFAVKQIQIYSHSHDVLQQIDALETEISILKGIRHSHIVEYYGMVRESDCLSIFMEYIPMGSLKDHINRYGCLTERVTSLYTRQILLGLAYLHSKMIIHRDIKGANILRDHSGILKLGDFGAAKMLQSQSVAETSKIAGTPYFMAPEIIRGEPCGCRADIWSLGCTVVEMLTKNPPWHKYDSIAAIYRVGSIWPPEYELLGETGDDVKDFLLLCFAKLAKDRAKAEELLIHSFITSRNSSQVS